MSKTESIHGTWASRWVFIFAAAGSAVGLGNIWKFPYIVGENGGGAFVLVYLACILMVGVPVMMGEVLIGRRARQSPVNALHELATETGVDTRWSLVGLMGVLAGFLIFSFYSVVAGWVLHYVALSGSGQMVDLGQEQAGDLFNGLLADPSTLFLWHSLFVALVMTVVAGGVINGLERATRLLMPALFALLVVLMGYSSTTGQFGNAWNFLFGFDFGALSWDGVLVALGHAFFTLSLGMGAIMAYGSYMPKKASIGGAVLTIAALDTLVALMSGLVIFPIVFATQMDPGAGPGLMFVTLPVAFSQMPGGQIIGFMFFVLVALAALSSAISLVEPAVAWLVERKGFGRLKSCALIGALVWLLGIGALGSFNFLSDFEPFGKNIFDLLDFVTANLLLPLGGICVALFVGWRLKQSISADELAISNPLLFKVWYALIRFVAPVAIGFIFLQNL
ncbi:sodium-dependent transporter [Marinobacterium arenosum]|uniref:sodium-dependent transporter n=1 Tax=Marinobacterium arenosum TaxID=2862496 RepID=UPI001C974736|nr:sodium-dependent transporter [Marinobacterium arenosum]MBY4677374.1 sodium-dependent transporter [Marinobacterium arenosum]